MVSILQKEWKIWQSQLFNRDLKCRKNSFVLTFYFVLALSFLYFATNHFSSLRLKVYFQPATFFTFPDGQSIDRAIPFIPQTLHIYSTLLAFFFVNCFFYPLNDTGAKRFKLILQAQFSFTVLALVIFIFCPAPVAMRDQVLAAIQGDSSYEYLFNILYALDTEYNSWPCLHIAHPLFITLTVQTWIKSKTKKVLLWVWLFLLLASIATTKQHYLWDLLSGGILALAFYYYTFKKSSS